MLSRSAHRHQRQGPGARTRWRSESSWRRRPSRSRNKPA